MNFWSLILPSSRKALTQQAADRTDCDEPSASRYETRIHHQKRPGTVAGRNRGGASDGWETSCSHFCCRHHRPETRGTEDSRPADGRFLVKLPAGRRIGRRPTALARNPDARCRPQRPLEMSPARRGLMWVPEIVADRFRKFWQTQFPWASPPRAEGAASCRSARRVRVAVAVRLFLPLQRNRLRSIKHAQQRTSAPTLQMLGQGAHQALHGFILDQTTNSTAYCPKSCRLNSQGNSPKRTKGFTTSGEATKPYKAVLPPR